jgi:putative alpha-1,2-mannosidase
LFALAIFSDTDENETNVVEKVEEKSTDKAAAVGSAVVVDDALNTATKRGQHQEDFLSTLLDVQLQVQLQVGLSFINGSMAKANLQHALSSSLNTNSTAEEMCQQKWCEALSVLDSLEGDECVSLLVVVGRLSGGAFH